MTDVFDEADPRPDDEIAQVLVVCTANIARSPLLMAMLEHEARRRVGPDAPVWVQSAGVHALVMESAAQGSAEEAVERGLDLSRHRAQQVDAGLVADADLVITLSESHRSKILHLVPRAQAHVFTVRELARLAAAMKPLPDGLQPRRRVRLLARIAHGARPYVARPDEREDVRDPYGGPRIGFAMMAAELDELVAAIAPQLFGALPGEHR